MKTYLGLLRGINVGGKNRLKMADLKSALHDADLHDVKTYIQSGNLVLDSTKAAGALEKLIANTVSDRFGFNISVFVRERSFFERVIKSHTFPGQEEFLHAMFLSGSPTQKRKDGLATLDFGDDRYSIVKNVVYLYYPNGCAKTKMTNNVFESRLKLSATTRNWRTVNKLVELAK